MTKEFDVNAYMDGTGPWEPTPPERHAHGRAAALAFALYLAAGLGLLGLVLWRLWTEVLAGIAQ